MSAPLPHATSLELPGPGLPPAPAAIGPASDAASDGGGPRATAARPTGRSPARRRRWPRVAAPPSGRRGRVPPATDGLLLGHGPGASQGAWSVRPSGEWSACAITGLERVPTKRAARDPRGAPPATLLPRSGMPPGRRPAPSPGPSRQPTPAADRGADRWTPAAPGHPSGGRPAGADLTGACS